MVVIDLKHNQIVLVLHAEKWLICIDLVFASLGNITTELLRCQLKPSVRGTRFTPARLFAGV